MNRRSKRKTEKEKRRKRSRAGGGRSRSLAPPQWLEWPVGNAYMSHLDAFRICGQGMMFYGRVGPDGKVALVTAFLDFYHGGFEDVYVSEVDSEEKFAELVLGEDMSKGGFLMEPIDPAHAARAFWGTYGFLCEQEGPQDEDMFSTLRAFIPTPAGGPRRWLGALTGTDGFLDARFLDVARQNQIGGDIPADKEPAVFTNARFGVEDADALIEFLRGSEPDISEIGPDEEGEGLHFCWTRAYPKGHWSPLAGPGARQGLGDVVAFGREVRVETKTASWAARFAQLLYEEFGSGVKLAGVEWKCWQEMLDGPGGSGDQ